MTDIEMSQLRQNLMVQFHQMMADIPASRPGATGRYSDPGVVSQELSSR